MKKFIALTLVVLFSFSIATVVFAEEEISIYGQYGNFENLYAAYVQAVEDNNLEKLTEINKIAEDSLNYEIQQAENRSKALRYDPIEDKYGYLKIFNEYFKNGYWETRDSGLTLSLEVISKTLKWPESDKDRAWNATYVLFSDNSNWSNTEMMKKQFYCHARMGYSLMEDVWNLEPWRETMNPLTCN